VTITIILGLVIFTGGIFLSTLDLVPAKYSQVSDFLYWSAKQTTIK